MFKSLQRGITLWVQAKTGLTGILVAWLGIAASAAIMMFVFFMHHRLRLAFDQTWACFGSAGYGGHFLSDCRCCRIGLDSLAAADQATGHS